jgi:hypothetical protein
VAPGVPAGAPPQASTVASFSAVAAAAARDSRQDPRKTTTGSHREMLLLLFCSHSGCPHLAALPACLQAQRRGGLEAAGPVRHRQQRGAGPCPQLLLERLLPEADPGPIQRLPRPLGVWLRPVCVPGCQSPLPQALNWTDLLDCTELIAAAHSAQHSITLPGFASSCLVLS